MWRDVMQVEASVRGHAGRAAHDHERQSLQHQAGKFCVLSVLFRFGVFRFVLIGVVLIGVVLIRFVLLPFGLCRFNFALWLRFFLCWSVLRCLLFRIACFGLFSFSLTRSISFLFLCASLCIALRFSSWK